MNEDQINLSYSEIIRKIASEVEGPDLLDPQIHIFLERLLAIVILKFSKPHQSTQITDDGIDFTSLLTFFDNPSSKKWHLNLNSLRKFVMNSFHIDEKSIPQIFCELEIGMNSEYQLEFSRKFLLSLFQLLFSWKTITITELKQQNSKIPFQTVNPSTLGDCYEQINLPQQKSRTQKGIFYSPRGEIRCTIAFTLYSYLEKNLAIINEEEKQQLFEILMTSIKSRRLNKKLSPKLREKCLAKLSKISILDPSCGSGSFLIQLLEQINQIEPNYWNHHSAKMFPKLYGADINPLASAISDFRIWCWMYKNYSPSVENWSLIYQTAIFIRTGDFLVDKTIFARNNPTYQMIVGNPPYIRNRDIVNPAGNVDLDNQMYRESLKQNLKEILKIPRLPTSRLDYSIYFCFHALSQLSPEGVLGFIISNSWMNVKYGAFFQENLLKSFQIRYIFDNLYRSFPTAEINTVITIIQNSKLTLSGKSIESKLPIHFVRFDKPYSFLFNSSAVNEISDLFNRLLRKNQLFTAGKQSIMLDHQKSERIFSISSQKLKDLSFSQSLIGHSWGSFFFNAPEFFFILNDELGRNLIFLNEIADIHRGITTNCNEFFILTHIDQDLYINGYGDQFRLKKSYLIPFLTSPKQLSSPLIETSKLKTFLFYTSDSKSELKERNATNILHYIEYGEGKRIQIKKGGQKGKYIIGVHRLASFKTKYQKSPETWYCLKNQKNSSKIRAQNKSKDRPRIIIQKIFNTTFKLGYSSDVYLPNNTFYEITLKPHLKMDIELLMSLLINSLASLSLELRGRINFGGGALDTATFDIGKILVLNPVSLSKRQKQELIEAGQPLFSQLFPKNLPKSLSIKQKILDQAILSHISMPLTPELVYGEFQRIQRIRTNKKYVEKKY